MELGKKGWKARVREVRKTDEIERVQNTNPLPPFTLDPKKREGGKKGSMKNRIDKGGA